MIDIVADNEDDNDKSSQISAFFCKGCFTSIVVLRRKALLTFGCIYFCIWSSQEASTS